MKQFGLILCNKSDGQERYWIASYKTEKGAIDAFKQMRLSFTNDTSQVSDTRCIIRTDGQDSIIEFN